MYRQGIRTATTLLAALTLPTGICAGAVRFSAPAGAAAVPSGALGEVRDGSILNTSKAAGVVVPDQLPLVAGASISVPALT